MNTDGYMLAYIRHYAGDGPWPVLSKYNISAYEASLARKRADTLLRRIERHALKAVAKRKVAA